MGILLHYHFRYEVNTEKGLLTVDSLMQVFMLVGGSIAAVLLIIAIGFVIIKIKAKKKATTSLPNGADVSEYTEDFIRQYDNQ
jgi:hypothetical protein